MKTGVPRTSSPYQLKTELVLVSPNYTIYVEHTKILMVGTYGAHFDFE